MSKLNKDPKVKKTLLRNYECKVRPTTIPRVVHEVDGSSLHDPVNISSSQPFKSVLSQPSLCSSEALANYLSDVKNSGPPVMSGEDLNVDRGQLSAEMTKKLNFHFNDRMYRNLIELNATFDSNLKDSKKDRKTFSSITLKKDIEPDIEDFCEDEKESDSPPKIPAIKPRLKPVRTEEDGRLHKLVSSFEVL